MPNPYDQWLDEMFGPLGGSQPEPQRPQRRQPAYRRRRPDPIEEAVAGPEQELEGWQKWGSMGARGLGGLIGFTPLTGAAGGAGGEVVAQMIEQKDLTPELDVRKIGGEAAAGAVGGGFAKMLGKLVGAPVKAAISGALMGGAAPVLRHGVGEGDWDPSNYGQEVALGAGVGGTTAGLLAKFLKVPDRGLPKAPGTSYQVDSTAVPGGRVLKPGGQGTDVVQPIKPISGSGVPPMMAGTRPGVVDDLRTPDEVATELQRWQDMDLNQQANAARGPYAGMPSVTKNQQRLIEKEQALAEKAADEARKAREIEEQIAMSGAKAQDPSFTLGQSAKMPDGSTLRSSQRFLVEQAEEGGDEVGELLAENHPYYVPKAGVDAAAPPAPVERVGLRDNLRKFLGDDPTRRRPHVYAPEAPVAPAVDPVLPPSAVAEPPAPASPLAELLAPKVAGKTRAKRVGKSKSQKFDEQAAKIAGQADEMPIAPEAPIAPVAAIPEASPLSKLQQILAGADPLSLRPAQEGLDLLGKEGRYGRLQTAYKIGKGSKEDARGAGKLLRYAAESVGQPTGKAAKVAAEVPPTVPPVMETPTTEPSWVADAQKWLSMTPEERAAMMAKEAPAAAPVAPAAAPVAQDMVQDVEPDWVKQALAEVEQLGASKAQAPVPPQRVADVAMDPPGGAAIAPDAPQQVQQMSELQKLLMASGAIKKPEDIAGWVAKHIPEEKLPPPVAPLPGKGKGASRQQLNAQGRTENFEPPLPQDYSPTPAAKPGKAKAHPDAAVLPNYADFTPEELQLRMQALAERGSKADQKLEIPAIKAELARRTSATSIPPDPKQPFAVVINEGGNQAYERFDSLEQANAFAEAARQSGKFKKGNISVVDTFQAQQTPQAPRLIKKKGEAGQVPLELMANLGLFGVGAAAGAVVDPFDNEILSALAGGAAAATLPTIAKGLTGVGANPTVVAHELEKLQTGSSTHEAAGKIARTLPQFIRFNYLADAYGLVANAGVGPWGSGVMSTLERGLSGDPRGWSAFQEIINPTNFIREWKDSIEEAQSLVGRAEGFSLNEASTPLEQGLALPGTALTTGDITIRRILQRHGFGEDEARAMTLTAEPFTKTGHRGAHLSGLGWDITFPFKRTPLNIAEQGFLRTPGLGSFMQGVGAKHGTRAVDPIQQQMVQQGMGLGTAVGAEQIAENLPEDQARTMRRFVTNAAGPYGLLAGLGYAYGNAKRRGSDSPIRSTIQTFPQQLPLPSVEPLQEAARFIAEPEIEEIPRGAYPAAAIEQYHELMKLLGLGPTPVDPYARRTR